MTELLINSIERLNDVNVDDLRNTKEMDNLLKVLKKKKRYLMVEKEKIKVIICCSTKDENTGSRIKEMLSTVQIESFVAHDGPDMPEKDIKRIIGGLDKVDVFIPILSDNFRNSDYCSQELGVAYFKNLLIISLSIDGTVPYGFISGFRSPPVSEDNIPIEYIIKLIADYFPRANINGKLIDALKEVPSSGDAECVMKILEPYFHTLSDDELNIVIDIFIENTHVQTSNLCRMEYLPKFIEINEDKIEKDKLKVLLETIKGNRRIKESKINNKEILDQEN